MEQKERIIESASTLFFRNGIKSITMSDIANETGISKRTLYEIFSNKEDLLEACLDFHRAKTENEIERLVLNSENVIDTLMRLYAQHFFQVLSVSRKIVTDLKKYHPRLYSNSENKRKERIHIFMPLLKKGIEQGLIRGDINFEILLWLLKVQFDAVLLDENSVPTEKYSVNQFLKTIIQIFMRGIATPLGNERIDKLIENYKDHEIKI
jgi:AcrR family transcriptional regulator